MLLLLSLLLLYAKHSAGARLGLRGRLRLDGKWKINIKHMLVLYKSLKFPYGRAECGATTGQAVANWDKYAWMAMLHAAGSGCKLLKSEHQSDGDSDSS